MAKAPSIDSDIEKAKAASVAWQAQAPGLFEQLGKFAKADQKLDATAEEADQKALEAFQKDGRLAEIALADLVHRLSQKVDALYAAFEAVDEPSRYERFVSFFSRRNAADHQSQRKRKVSLSGSLNDVLFSADRMAGIAADGKAFGLDLSQKCEPVSLAFTERRNRLSAAVETARQDLKEQNAALATVQWKAGNTTDEVRSAALLAERDALSLAVENAEATYRSVRAAHDGLDRYLLLFDTFVGYTNDGLSGSSLLLNRLLADMERALQLQIAVSTSLDALSRQIGAKPSSAYHHLAELVQLHANHSISLEDINRRRRRCEDGFLNRYMLEKNRVTGRADGR